MSDAIIGREIFSYNYSQSWWHTTKKNCHSIFCCCCGCFKFSKRKVPKSEKIFKSATSKLYAEIDILEIVKQIRMSRFLASVMLTESQRELVKFMKAYTLYNPKSKKA